jgi:hypothetical protein
MAVEREVIVEQTPSMFEGMKISWGGVFGGVLAAWLTFVALVLSLLAAIAGAAMGRRGVMKRVEE